MARFLPGLTRRRRLAECERSYRNAWATLRNCVLDQRDGLHGEIEPGDFDSLTSKNVSPSLDRNRHPTDGVIQRRSRTILHEGQTVFLPTFTVDSSEQARSCSKSSVFWNPGYPREKPIRLQQFRTHAEDHASRFAEKTVDESIPDLEPSGESPTKQLLHRKRVLDCIEFAPLSEPRAIPKGNLRRSLSDTRNPSVSCETPLPWPYPS